MNLKKYQRKATNKIVEDLLEWLGEEHNRDPRRLLFKGPTACGKTLTMFHSMAETKKEYENVVFLYICFNSLPEQTKKEFENYAENNGSLKCQMIDSEAHNNLKPGEIGIIKWQKTNKKNNRLMIDGETKSNLKNIIKNIRKKGCKVILYIDEPQHTAGTENSQNTINIINPDIIMYISATPDMSISYDDEAIINEKDVKNAQMIRKKIITNERIKYISGIDDSIFINASLDKRKSLKRDFRSLNLDFNPLLLIQLPNLSDKYYDIVYERTIKSLKDQGITFKNGKLAINISEDKRNVEFIRENNSKVDVLLFKEGLIYGWNCPRAYLCLMLRGISDNLIVRTQLEGRIIRTLGQKYYPIESLNYGYIYHNSLSLEIESDNGDLYYNKSACRSKDAPTNIQLPSSSTVQYSKYYKIESNYKKFFNKAATTNKLKNNISLKVKDFMGKIGTDGEINNFDKTGSVEEKIVYKPILDERQLQIIFEKYILEKIKVFQEPCVGLNMLKDTLRNYFVSQLNLSTNGIFVKMQKIILSDKDNKALFDSVLNESIENYKKHWQKQCRKSKEKFFKIPSELHYRLNSFKKTGHKLIKSSKSYMQPFYMLEPTGPELLFLDWIHENPNVKGFYKNGTKDKEGIHFGITYDKSDGTLGLFHPDWLVFYVNGSIGIYDTKEGRTASEDDAGPKAKCLYNYILKVSTIDRLLHGGIVTFEKGSCYINSLENYSYDRNNLLSTGWEIFSGNFMLIY